MGKNSLTKIVDNFIPKSFFLSNFKYFNLFSRYSETTKEGSQEKHVLGHKLPFYDRTVRDRRNCCTLEVADHSIQYQRFSVRFKIGQFV